MGQERQIDFGPFRLDPIQRKLWRETQEIELQPRPLAVLQYLVEHAGRVVPKEELLKQVWQGTYVTKTALKVSIRAIRKALNDDTNNPQYLETVGWEGYRFLGGVVSSQYSVASSLTFPFSPTPGSQYPTPFLVGREIELTQLHGWLRKALNGERQVVFVTGEPGIGKTTLVDVFLQSLGSRVLESKESQKAKIGARGWGLGVGPSSQAPSLKSQVPGVLTQPSALGPQTSSSLNPQPLTPIFIGRGQCLEQYGEGEPYLPVLEALGQMCRGSAGEQMVRVLAQYAPTWLIQMPSLVNAEELEAVQRRVVEATRERMLREMAEALEALTVERGLVLVLEDLHVSDRSTVELLAYLAQRRERAKLLVVGTYRPRDVVVREHPLTGVKQALDAHGNCAELRVELLGQTEVEEYVVKRLATNTIPTKLTKLIYHRTDGNALFMVNVVDYCLQQHLVVQEEGQWRLKVGVEALGVPESVQQMIAKQIEGLHEDEQQVLEIASVAGSEFAVTAVAAALQSEIDAVEVICEELAQKSHFLREEGVAEWPDGTVSGRYAFRHVLYQNVLYERIAAARRVRLHCLIGEREEAGYGASARTIAVELAVHFECGRDYQRAVQYLQLAGENAIQRSAYQEAMDHLTKGLALLSLLPDTPKRARQELSLQVAMSLPLMVTKTPATPELEKVYSRARELCEQVGATPELFPVLWNLWSCHEARAQWTTARELAEQLLALAHDAQDSALLLQAHHAQWTTLVNLGELRSARAHFEQGLTLYNPQQYRSQVFLCGGHDPGVCCRNISSLALWLLGYPDQALNRKREALTLGQELSHPLSLAGALGYAAVLHQFRREEQTVQTLAEAAIALSTKHELVFTLTHGTILRSWALAQQGRDKEGIAQIQQGLAARRARETEANLPYYLALLAEVYRKAGQAEEALSTLAEALEAAHKTGERFYEAELYRLKGELTLQQSRTSLGQISGKSRPVRRHRPLIPDLQAEAEGCFLKAIDLARRQQAKSLELRAVMSLARLWQSPRKHHEARNMLIEIYGWFTEGFDTKDLREAKALLEELHH